MGQQGGLAGMMLPLAMFAAIFYFLIIRPQKKKQKAHENMLASISKGSEIVTAGGFFGIVREVLDDSYIVELAEGIKVRILKSSISIKRNEGEKSDAPKKEKKKKKRLQNDDAVTAEPVIEAEEKPVSEAIPAEAEIVELEAAAEQPVENDEDKA